METQTKTLPTAKCHCCKRNVEHINKSGDHSMQCEQNGFSIREMITKQSLLIPTPGVLYTNLHPSLTRYQDSLTSTDRRINQGADQIDEARAERISETRDSQTECLRLIPQQLMTENAKEQPKKPKGHFTLHSDDISGCPVFGGVSHVGASNESYRNVMQSANLINFNKKPQSITSTDFQPKILYPFNSSQKGPHNFEPSSPEWMKYRKKISYFVDLDVPKRDECYTFLDDEQTFF